ncbi:MAG: sterol desaturase family protein [Chloroflexota bacterium]|nr:sterol desaturase family protein [Chloroflexota bacterium]
MAKIKVKSGDEPIRLFKSDFLEFFTHISPIIVLVVWLPVIGFFVYRSLVVQPVSPLVLVLGIVFGLFLWTLAEYTLHRFLFHFPAKTPWQERLSFLAHGVHHASPRDKTRLVMPPVVSIPLALVFYGLYFLIFTYVLLMPNWISPVFTGFILGYVAYDMTHYATHHFSMKKGYFRMVRQQHMRHHFQTPDKRFGVTSPVWDYVFGTMPEEA